MDIQIIKINIKLKVLTFTLSYILGLNLLCICQIPPKVFNDTTEISQNIDIGKSLMSTFPDSAIFIFENTYNNAVKIKYHKGAVQSILELSNIEVNKGNYRYALELLYKANIHTNENFNAELLAGVHNNIGNIYGYQSLFDSAVFHYLLALKYKEQYHSSQLETKPPIAYIYNNLSFAFLELQNYSQGIYFLQKTKIEAEKIKDTKLLTANYNNTAGYYFKQNKMDSSAQAYKTAIIYALKIKEINSLFRAYTGLSNVFDRTGVIDSAISYSLKAYELYSSNKLNKYGYNILLCNIGSLYRQKKQFKKAKSFYQIVEKDSSKTIQESALLLARQAELYAELGDYKKAYSFKDAYHKLNDSLKSADIAVKISDLESRYELSKKDKALLESDALLNAQKIKTQQRNLWIWLLSLSIISVIIIAIVWFRQQQKRQKAEQIILNLKSKIEGEEKEKTRIAHDLHDSVNSQLSAAKSFLISTENTSPELASLKSFITAKEILTDTSIEVRNIAHNLAPDTLLNDGLIAAIAVFCKKLFLAAGIEHHLDAAGDFDAINPDLSLTSYRIVQELCNNVVKHSNANTVTILLTNDGNAFNIVVEDNGKGIVDIDHNPDNGIGLQGVRDRVMLYNGTLQIDTMPNSHTAFYINFPLEKK